MRQNTQIIKTILIRKKLNKINDLVVFRSKNSKPGTQFAIEEMSSAELVCNSSGFNKPYWYLYLNAEFLQT